MLLGLASWTSYASVSLSHSGEETSLLAAVGKVGLLSRKGVRPRIVTNREGRAHLKKTATSSGSELIDCFFDLGACSVFLCLSLRR